MVDTRAGREPLTCEDLWLARRGLCWDWLPWRGVRALLAVQGCEGRVWCVQRREGGLHGALDLPFTAARSSHSWERHPELSVGCAIV
ncbi:hypothetical protein [Kibdelosporangium philippinense]|uniref:hypothetical protein n=1 Tax=Kibdelosporangium philippinense TaxID=211113 RepID=UPI0036236FD3